MLQWPDGLDAPAPAVGGAARGVARVAEPVADQRLEPRYLRHRRLGAEPLDRKARELARGGEPVLHALGAERDGHQHVALEDHHCVKPAGESKASAPSPTPSTGCILPWAACESKNPARPGFSSTPIWTCDW